MSTSEKDAAPAPLEGTDYIRPFAAPDRDMVEQIVGQGFMEGLTTANNRGECLWAAREWWHAGSTRAVSSFGCVQAGRQA